MAERPPESRREDLVEVLHGVSVADPYRWLEDGESTETRGWVDAQNRFTRAVMDRIPQRMAISAKLDDFLTTGMVGAPVVRGSLSFYQRRDGRLDQPVLVVRDAAGPERTILDPNALSANGIVALDWWYPSHDGGLLAYGVSEGGTELSTLRILDVERCEPLANEVIPYTRAASLAWLPDSSGFYYTRYPSPGSVPHGEEMYHRHVFSHRLGESWEGDEEVFGAGRAREDWPNVELSRSGRWLAVEIQQGWVRSEVYVCDRHSAKRDFFSVFVGFEATAHPIFAGDQLLLHTNLDAPNWSVYAVDPAKPERPNWRSVIAEPKERVLDSVHPVAGSLLAHEMLNASSRVRIYSLDGAAVSDVALPSLGTITGLGGEWEGSRIGVGFTSFTQANTAYEVDPSDGRIAVLAQGSPPEGVDARNYQVRQDWYTSRDGTRVSIFVVYRRDIPLDQPRPTVLTGYGGFNVSRTPMFTPALPLWLDAGGVYALANLRGGGEYGEEWHRAGMLGKKQNVFDDFIAAAEWLVGTGITAASQLAISGGSNGGLLVGAALTQRPELFKAVVCQVPLLDMLRYQHLRIARLWIPEYGSAEDPAQFAYLYAYSPYHQVRSGTAYPAVFLLTAEGDSRVDPMHARKMAAALQSATASVDAPVILRVETAAGHGQGKPRGKQLDEATDIWSFLFWQLGVAT